MRSATTAALIPLEALVKVTQREVRREVLHDDQLPAIRLYVRERFDVGPLPPGVAASWRTIEP